MIHLLLKSDEFLRMKKSPLFQGYRCLTVTKKFTIFVSPMIYHHQEVHHFSFTDDLPSLKTSPIFVVRWFHRCWKVLHFLFNDVYPLLKNIFFSKVFKLFLRGEKAVTRFKKTKKTGRCFFAFYTSYRGRVVVFLAFSRVFFFHAFSFSRLFFLYSAFFVNL